MKNAALILASSSTYRRELLSRLQLSFTWQSPDVDEAALPDETPYDMVLRLAQAKADAIQKNTHNDSAIIIASDQCSVVDNTILGKPHTEGNAIAQLDQCSGKIVTFYTSLCMQNAYTKRYDVVPYHVQFRTLSIEEITRYVTQEQPLDCAGSFKCEGLGISLFAKQSGDDPTALIGLPLIKTCEYLRAFGVLCP